VSIVLALFIIGAGFRLAGVQGSATDFATADYLPKLDANAAVLWATMVFAYGGAEGVALLRNEAKGGARTIVTALIMVGVGLTVAYVLGTTGMLMILPQAEAAAGGGFPAALGVAAQKLGVADLAPWLVGALGIVMLGGLNAWFGVAARLPFAVGIDNMLPAVIGRRDPKTGAPYVAIWLQGGLVIVITALTQVGVDSLNKLYGLIQAMSTLTYTLPFLFMFAAWWKADSRPWARWTAVFGFLVALSGVLCSLVPGEGTTVADVLKLAGSGAILVVSGCIIYVIYLLRRKAS
jgi:amino acid transporter